MIVYHGSNTEKAVALLKKIRVKKYE